MPSDFLRPLHPFREFGRNHVAALGTGATVLLIIGLQDQPNSWMTALCLLPLVLACLLDVWYTIVVAATLWVLPQMFGSVIWLPGPRTTLIVLSVVCLAEMQQRRAELRAKERQHEDEERQQEEWAIFFENNPAAIVSADGHGRIVLANRAAHKLLGVENGSLPGQALHPCLPALASALRIERESPIMHTINECRGWRPDHSMFMADVCFSVTNTVVGTRLGAVLVDASERLQERERRALRSSMASSEIAMGAVLHEIRNLSAAAALMHTNLEKFPKITENPDFQALGNLVRALAKIASAELRPGEGSQSSVDLHALLDQLRIIIDPWFEESEMQVKWNIATDLPHVWGENAGLMQIFMNLAQNSNKAMVNSQERELTISGSLEDDFVVVRFIDTGPGVQAPEQLFEALQSRTGLKGLGLYLSRAIAHSICGDLKWEPTSRGSCFAVQLLPLRPSNPVSAFENKSAQYKNSYR